MIKLLSKKHRKILLIVALGLLFILWPSKKVSATYDGANLIENGAFLNSRSMSLADIQSFLVSKGGGIANMSFPLTCYGSGSREWSLYTSAGAPCGQTVLASQHIYYASQVYGMNPQVILATLQKEQSLVTTPSPDSWQINQAMGYGCPTSGSCSDSSNFFYQIDNGTWVLRYHYERANGNTTWWNSGSYTCGNKSSHIYYSYYKPGLLPGQSVTFYDGKGYYYMDDSGNYVPGNGVPYRTYTLANAATAALYCYTPHAYNNPQGLYGLPIFGTTGMYYTGSYNFVKFFQLWFDPNAFIKDSVVMRTITTPDTTPARGQTVTYSISFTNNLTDSITLDGIGIVGRAGSINGANRDFGWQPPVTIAAGATQQFTFTAIIRDTGIIYAWPAVIYHGSYVHYNNWGTALNAHAPNISLITPLSSSISNPIASQTATLSATIKNNEDQPITFEAVGIPVRYYGTYNYDTAWITPVSPIQPGATQVLSGSLTFDKPGPYTAWVSALIAGQFTTISSNLDFNASKPTPNFQLTYTETPNTNPALGEDVKVKFKLKNNSGIAMTLDAIGVVGRYDNPYNGASGDLGWIGPVSFADGEESPEYSFVSNISELKNFYTWVAIKYQNNYIHYNNWGFMMTPHLPNITITTPLTINSGSPPAFNQSNPVTVTVINNEPNPIRFSAVGIPVRYYDIYNYDAVWLAGATLQPGATQSISGSIFFDKHGPYTLWTSMYIQGRYITIGDQKKINL